ncbi:MAG: T9SS type A sorting domain-containing protein [Ignavibacteriales bacterium]|nr:T9SS type A sorting domain-containing protein [Ignavibacteriales bacterium]
MKPLPPAQVTASYKGSAVTVQWNQPAKAADGDTAKYYVVYRFATGDSADVGNSKYIRKISPSDTLRYVDAAVAYGKQYTYIVTSLDKLSNESDPTARVTITATGVGEPLAAAHYNFMLDQNYPNPFNPSTTIRYTLASGSHVKLQVLSVLGRVVATLADGEQSAGMHSTVWNADVSSGMYFYRMEAVSTSDPGKRFVDVKRMVLMR